MHTAISRFGLLLVLSLGITLPVFGQGRGFSAPARGFSAPARTFAAPSRGFPGSTRPGATRRGSFQPFTATPLSPNFAPINGVPGLGFDFPHLAAVSRGFRSRFRGFRFGGISPIFTPIFFDSLPVYYPYENEMPDYYATETQKPFFLIPSPQQPAPAQPEAPARESATPQVPPSPPPELGQLILVRSDGQVLLAVAFTVRNGQLTYITNDGTRRSFPVSELDKEATRQMNDANGTSVSLPN